MTLEQALPMIFGRTTHFCEQAHESAEHFEDSFISSMMRKHFVADLDDDANNKVGYVVLNDEGVTWHTYPRDRYEQFVLAEETELASRNL